MERDPKQLRALARRVGYRGQESEYHRLWAKEICLFIIKRNCDLLKAREIVEAVYEEYGGEIDSASEYEE